MMDARISALVSNPNDVDFNAVVFEKKLMQLKDSQESINALSAWCLENRAHHKKIVTAWLNVLKKVKVEHRLTLFYLANDVIQYSKRKNYDFVESWGTTLQKATTMVREEKVKNRILRIFKIWEQRGIYGEEFIADLSGLISASPAGRKDQDPQDFQPSYLINRIRSCAKLESDTDLKLKVLKDNNPKIIDSDTICASLKDRKHFEDVEIEVENSIKYIEGYVGALKTEIKSRTHLIACLAQADTFYGTERKEVKVVVSAYRNFTSRVKNLQKKLDELIPTLNSPLPSPDVNAPSPEPDSDIELPNPDGADKIKCDVAAGVNVYSMTENYSANYYTPASNQSQDNFANNGFTSFMGSNMPFNLQNFNTSNLFSEQNHSDTYNNSVDVHMIPEPVPQPAQPYEATQVPPSVNYNPTLPNQHAGVAQPTYTQPQQQGYNPPNPQPLLPPPLPPFTTAGYMDSGPYTDTTYAPTVDSYTNNSTYEAVGSVPYAVTSEIQPAYAQPPDAYNPEEELETWEPEGNWDGPPDMETPESPPMFEKEGFADPIEYDETKSVLTGIGKDVDHRVLLPPPQIPSEITGTDTDHRMGRMGGSKDVDHRNLISLTGSPHIDQPTSSSLLQPPPAPPPLWPGHTGHTDQDYRNNVPQNQDQDYRLPMPADIARQLTLPPPPPPPPKVSPQKRSFGDNVESIDMDLSDDESSIPLPDAIMNNNVIAKRNRPFENNKMVELTPPPIPNLNLNMSELNECESETVLNLGAGKIEAEIELVGPPPIPQLCELNAGWVEDWPPVAEFEFQHQHQRGPPPEFQHQHHERPSFQPNFQPMGRHKNEFRGGFRGRGRGNFLPDEGFRGRAPRMRGGMRTRPFRGGFNNRGRGFRGQFRGGF